MTTAFRSESVPSKSAPDATGPTRHTETAQNSPGIGPRLAKVETDKGMLADRRRATPRTYGVILLVLVIGLLVSGAVTWTSWTLNNRNESQLLAQQTSQARDVLVAALPSTATPL